MRFIKKLLGIANDPVVNSDKMILDCPNCWGTQEYANESREYSAESKTRKAFVSQFVETHITGIRP